MPYKSPILRVCTITLGVGECTTLKGVDLFFILLTIMFRDGMKMLENMLRYLLEETP